MKSDAGPAVSRREFLHTAGVAAAALLATRRGESMESPSERPSRPPNIIYVFADQLRYQSCGYAGDRKAKTPHLDAFASQGTSFQNAVSGHPVCAPYRASMLTGKYTTSTGMVINEMRLNPNHESLAHVLTRGGYETAYIGKWHLYANQLGNHEDPKNSFTPPGPHRLGFDGFWASYGFHHENYRGYYHTDSQEKIPVKGYEPDAQTDLAIEQIRRHAKSEKPFALFLSIGAPHDPWNPGNVPPEFLAKFADETFTLPPNYKPENDPYADAWGRYQGPEERKKIPDWMKVYYAMVANVDWNFGRILEAIEKAGIREDTIVVFTSDHGEMFGAQGRRAKNIFYEEAVRVPFVVRWPGKTPPGRVSDACLNTPDIMPTLLSMAGMPIPAKVEGTDLSHCALGKPGPEPEAAFMQNTGACAIWEDGYEWRGLRSKRHTYAIYRKDGKEFLFDNKADPYQMVNLAEDAEHKETLDRFRDLLKKQMARVGDTNEASTWYRDHWTKDRVITFTR